MSMTTWNPFTGTIDFIGSGGGGGGSGGVNKWNLASSVDAPIQMVNNNGYMTDGPLKVDLIMPLTAKFGDVIRVVDFSDDRWEIHVNPGQMIHYLENTTTTGTGSIVSLDPGCDVEMICVIEDTQWDVISGDGNVDVL